MTLPISTVTSASAPATTSQSQTETALRKAAQEFEAILLREMLKSVEKCGKLGGGGTENSGQSIYGSMIVDAVAQAVSQAGGLGLTEVITKAWNSAEGATGKPSPLQVTGAQHTLQHLARGAKRP